MDIDNLVKTATESIAEHDVFGELLNADEKQYLMERGVVQSFGTGQVICRQHERDATLYIILLGEVEVSEGEKNNKLVLAHLDKGEVFGEISALFRMPRISSVVAAKPTVVLEIAGDIFEKMIENNSALRNAIIKRFGDRLIETALRAVSFLRYLPVGSLTRLIQEASLVSLAPGNTIVTEGEPGDAMFIIVHGAAKVLRSLDEQALPLAIIGPGDYFGEWSVMTGAPRTATVTALSHIEVIRIERETLLHFIQDNPDVRHRLDQIAHNRHNEDADDFPRVGTDDHTRQSIESINLILNKNK